MASKRLCRTGGHGGTSHTLHPYLADRGTPHCTRQCKPATRLVQVWARARVLVLVLVLVQELGRERALAAGMASEAGVLGTRMCPAAGRAQLLAAPTGIAP